MQMLLRTSVSRILALGFALAFAFAADAQQLKIDEVVIPGDTVQMSFGKGATPPSDESREKIHEVAVPKITVYGIRNCRYFYKVQDNQVLTTVVVFKVNRRNLRRFKHGFEQQFDRPEISNDWTTNHRKVDTTIFWMMELDGNRSVRGRLVKEGRILTFRLALKDASE